MSSKWPRRHSGGGEALERQSTCSDPRFIRIYSFTVFVYDLAKDNETFLRGVGVTYVITKIICVEELRNF
jgi:hypothetical protein